MIASVATPSVTASGVAELRRSWTPEGDIRAELVIVHGIGEHSGRYERPGALFAARGFAVRSFDLIGHGASGGHRTHVDNWVDYLDQLQVHVEEARSGGKPVALLGHSMGGTISLEYALSTRPPPDALILSAPGLGGGKAWQKALAPRLASLAPRLAIPTAIKGDQLSSDPAVGEAYFADPLVSIKATARLGAELFSAMDRLNAHLVELDLPTLVITGGNDTLVPPQSSLPLAAVAKRILYPKLRHELFNEPEGPDVVTDVADWLESVLTMVD